jgi:acyloxyacyl hydrolase
MAANEADWPACAWSTAVRDPSVCPRSAPLFGTPAASIYQRMRARNLCAHRDYQNVGVNGARTSSMAPPNGIVGSLARNQTTDAPLLAIFALIGNDVCDSRASDASWTSVVDFKANVLRSLDALDATLPSGSHVAFVGLVDGRVLYNTTHTLTHPLGLTYPEVYDFLNCNKCSPCFGWLNSNSTWRDRASERAAVLSAVYDDIIATRTYAHFDMYRVKVDWVKIIADYVAVGGVAADVIEPVDGFHPSQTGNFLLAETVWEDLLANKPSFLGAVNPHNADIARVFGDQGGYE